MLTFHFVSNFVLNPVDTNKFAQDTQHLGQYNALFILKSILKLTLFQLVDIEITVFIINVL